MSRSNDALINSPLLVWARKSARMSLEESAEKLGITTDKLRSWEQGEARPTIRQLQNIASIYKQSFAAFYLADPPELFRPPVQDYRLLEPDDERQISSRLYLDFRSSIDRRAIYLELLEQKGQSPLQFEARTTLSKDPEDVGTEVRRMVGITLEAQSRWNDPRLAFNAWRSAIESQGILVFQTKGIALEEMRGYSIATYPLPIIVINRKDAYSGRIFTLLHELAHLLLRAGGVCDLFDTNSAKSEIQKTEAFCNQVAAAALVPRSSFLSEPIVRKHRGRVWEDDELKSLGKYYSVSREVVLRRALTLGLTDKVFYQQKRKDLQREYEGLKKEEGFVPPYTDVLSLTGKPYVKAVLDSFYAERINGSDLCDYLGMKLQHLEKLSSAVGI